MPAEPPPLQRYSLQKLCQRAHKGEGKDARHLTLASSHFLGSRYIRGVLSTLSEKPPIPFCSCKMTSGMITVQKGVRKPLRSAVSNQPVTGGYLCFLMALGDSAAVRAEGQRGVPRRPGHRHLGRDGVQPVVQGIQNQRQEPVRYSQRAL